MEPLVAAAVGVALVACIAVLVVRARRRSATAAESDSSDDETSGPLSVDVVADHDEQDSLLPTFAGLLRSPWHSVTAVHKEQPKRMRPVRNGSRAMSLTMPLPLRKKSKPAEVPVKKLHVPYFFPLLDETAHWWQAQQSATEPQPTPEAEPEADSERNADVKSCNQTKEDVHSAVSTKDPLQEQQPHHFSTTGMSAIPIEVGGH
ncbi:unnamed protein product [Phytophthora lilii]|uniref:Unnamed protein product n=1 Tax=Phytophthora lilii TaxID=2077276 RepID=A0A9W6TWR0_9STRA|nr:unnamed protein product [Phytophthora lilii]